jgi:hypothetical protein
MKRELYIKPSGKLFTLSRGKYKVRLKRVNEVLFSLNIEGHGSVLITAKNGDLFFENGKKSSKINVNNSCYFEILGNDEMYVVSDIASTSNGELVVSMKRYEILDGEFIPVASPASRATGGYFMTSLNGPLATFNPAIYRDFELVREVYNLPTFVGLIAVYKSGERKKNTNSSVRF